MLTPGFVLIHKPHTTMAGKCHHIHHVGEKSHLCVQSAIGARGRWLKGLVQFFFKDAKNKNLCAIGTFVLINCRETMSSNKCALKHCHGWCFTSQAGL